MEVDYALYTDKGKRDINEDGADVICVGKSFCFVLADGLGGHGRGDEASACAVQTAREVFSGSPADEAVIACIFEKAQERLLELQKEGYIRFWRGKGIRIVSLDKDAIHDIMEMRLCLEKETAEMAARRADPGDLEYICACLEESRLHLDSKDIDLCYRLDHKFHRAVGKAAHNQLLYRALDDVLDRYLQFEVLSIYQSYVDAHAIWEAHDHIYKAIAAGDADRARAAAKTHLEDAYRRTLEKYWIG